ncbi:MAG: amidohydrolase family protein [Planctomycetota bacterium]
MALRAIGAAALAVACVAQAAAVQSYERFVMIKAGKVITVSGEEITRGDIIIEDGKISLVGIGLETPSGARVIDARDQTVMPGIIVPRTRADLTSYNRRGIRADLRTIDEIDFDDMDFEPMLEHGVTAIAVYPSGEAIPGAASVVRTAGIDRERVLRRAGYVRALMTSLDRGKKSLRDGFGKAQAELDKVEKAKEEWDAKQKKAAEAEAKKEEKPADKGDDKPEGESDGKASRDPESSRRPTPEPKPDESPEPEDGPGETEGEDKGDAKPEEFTPPEIDKTVKPLADMIEGRGPTLLVEVNGASGVLHTKDAVRKYEKVKPAFYAPGSFGINYNNVVSTLGDAKARVLTTPVLSRLEFTSVRYNLPAELAAAGAQLSLTPANTNEATLRRYRSRVAELVRSGLPREDALKAMTLNAARLIGVSDRVGSIEPERSADLMFLDGDPLDPHARVTRVMIEGVTVWERDDAEG